MFLTFVKWSYLNGWNAFTCWPLHPQIQDHGKVYYISHSVNGRSEAVTAWWFKFSFAMTHGLVLNFRMPCSRPVLWAQEWPQTRVVVAQVCQIWDLGLKVHDAGPVQPQQLTCSDQTVPTGTSPGGEKVPVRITVIRRQLCPPFNKCKRDIYRERITSFTWMPVG